MEPKVKRVAWAAMVFPPTPVPHGNPVLYLEERRERGKESKKK